MRILIFNVKYSPNLGDGVLAECLEKALARHLPTAEVETIDLAGRTGFAGKAGRGRLAALNLLSTLPRGCKRAVVKTALTRKLDRLETEWAGRIRSADAIVIGGGNLFQDDDLNFPLKIAALLRAIGDSGKPVAVAGVGVTAAWSPAARRLFAGLLQKNLVFTWVRDERSADNWRRHFGLDAAVYPDPGVAAQGLLDCDPVADGSTGVGVTHPSVLRRHASGDARSIPLRTASHYADLCTELARRGQRIRLFTNGAVEDRMFLGKVMRLPAMKELYEARILSEARAPTSPYDLIDVIVSHPVIASHRLHASIVAHSFGRGHVGLAWDSKVQSFYAAIGRRDFFVARAIGPADLARLLTDALQDGAARSARLRTSRQVYEAIGAMSDRLMQKVPHNFDGPAARGFLTGRAGADLRARSGDVAYDGHDI